MAGRRSGELSKSKSKPGRPCYDLLPEEQVDYFLVLDFEGVNNKYHGGPDIMEIIEFPVLKVNAQTLETESIFHSYVQPTIHTQLNPVCTEITGITQAMVMGQPTLPWSFEAVGRLDESRETVRRGGHHLFCYVWRLGLKSRTPHSVYISENRLPWVFAQVGEYKGHLYEVNWNKRIQYEDHVERLAPRVRGPAP